MKGRNSRLLAALLITSSWTGLAQAQTADQTPPPVHEVIDANGVDLFAGSLTITVPGVSIGNPAAGGLAYSRTLRRDGLRDSFEGTVDISGSTYTVTLDGMTEQFVKSGSIYTPVEQHGASFDGTKFVDASGNVATFTHTNDITLSESFEHVTSVVRTDGTVITYNYFSAMFNPGPGAVATVTRLQSITTNTGYMLYMSYAADGVANSDPTSFMTLVKVNAINRATNVNCNPTTPGCSVPTSYYTVLANGVITDANGGATKYTYNNYGIINLTRPGSASYNVTVTHNTATTGTVSSLTADGVDTTYTYNDSGNTRTTTVKRPGSVNGRVLTFDIPTLHVLTDTDEIGHKTTYAYYSASDTAAGRLKSVKHAEGDTVVYHYDTRGNVTSADAVSKDSGTTYTTSTDYEEGPTVTSCVHPVTCNRPFHTSDIRGKVTTYSYDPTHGGVTSVTAPAVTGVASQTRYSYAQRQAYIKSGASAVAAGPLIWKTVGTSQCQTGAAATPGGHAACEGTADEVKTTVVYGSTSGVNNLLPTSSSVSAGDGTLTATTVTTYDDVGDVRSVDGALSGTADTTWFRYDILRRQTGTISPDPDGSGARKPRAQETTYNPDGTVAAIDVGTDTSPSANDWSTSHFTSITRQEFSYLNSRKTSSRTIDKGGPNPGTKSAVQWSYDTRGRLDCTAVRMTTANYDTDPEYTALPAACTVKTAGDRITKTLYDPDDRPLTSQVLDSSFTTVGSTTYTMNGKTASVTDGKGNVTGYKYDGFDRLVETDYPGGGTCTASSGDCETRTYDVPGNKVYIYGRERGGDTHKIELKYDDLGRLEETVRSQSGEVNPTYSYDNLGRLLKVTNTTSTAEDVSFTWDALGRQLTETSPTGTMASAWNIDGTRNRLTWGDGYYVSYDYQVTGEMLHIRQNGTTLLATFGYDDLGRRTSLVRGNGTTTSYGYDGLSRLTSLALGFPADSGSNESVTFGYNPAGQMISRSATNDTYSWDQPGNVGNTDPSGRPYVANALNQYSTIGNAPTAYNYKYEDKHGNLTRETFPGGGGYLAQDLGTFVYTSDNLLHTSLIAPDPRSGDTLSFKDAFTYDNLNRLQQTTGGGVNDTTPQTSQYGYDGSEVVGEYDASDNLKTRYVRGPAADEPLVAVDNSGSLTYYHADERGSLLAQSNASGVRTAVNTYDEYGIPSNTSFGTFGYTGQMYLRYLGMSFYKTRVYSPTLGRFLQTDSAGYGDGANWYNYAHADPINGSDPNGTTDYSAASYNALKEYAQAASEEAARGQESAYYEEGLIDANVSTYGVYFPNPDQEEHDAWYQARDNFIGAVAAGSSGTLSVRDLKYLKSYFNVVTRFADNYGVNPAFVLGVGIESGFASTGTYLRTGDAFGMTGGSTDHMTSASSPDQNTRQFFDTWGSQISGVHNNETAFINGLEGMNATGTHVLGWRVYNSYAPPIWRAMIATGIAQMQRDIPLYLSGTGG